MLWPTKKTEVVPIFVSRAQGSGKSTFGESICAALFGVDNVIISHQYDGSSRFNADHADALVVCIEEKEEKDKRNTTSMLKSSATATRVRKENKGVDPIYQKSYTDYVMTTNGDVPIKFDDTGRQRRFMVMESDAAFTRETSAFADEIFTKIYGVDADGVKHGIPFTEDYDLISQFKHELFTDEKVKNTKLKDFPKTEAYNRCFSIPRTNDNVDIEMVLRGIAPFIQKSLESGMIVGSIELEGEVLELRHMVPVVDGLLFRSARNGMPARVAVNMATTFTEMGTGRQYAHASVSRAIIDAKDWLAKEYRLVTLPGSEPPDKGYRGVNSRYRNAPSVWFTLAPDKNEVKTPTATYTLRNADVDISLARLGERVRFNKKWKPDPEGEYETINEMLPGATQRVMSNAAHMDTFLLEGDTPTKTQLLIEGQRLKLMDKDRTYQAESMFMERLELQRAEAERMFRKGIVARVVYSGFKSYHLAIRVAPAPTTFEEYTWLHGHLCTSLSNKVIYDPVCSDVLRLTRAPADIVRYDTYEGYKLKGLQHKVLENWSNTYYVDWGVLYQQWLDRPLTPLEKSTGKKLIPMKLEYEQVAYALCGGTFWTDDVWNGRRQQLFFPAYRILRLLGFDHDTLWSDGGILDGIDNYYKRGELAYWKGRESSDLIARIDSDFDDDKEFTYHE
jgi:hypothetical protein